MTKFNIGDKVNLSQEGKARYPNTTRNPHQGVGAIIFGQTSMDVRVKWSNGRTNSYYNRHLELTQEQLPYTMNQDAISVFLDGKMYVVPATDICFEELKEHLSGEHDKETIMRLVDKPKMIEEATEGFVKVSGNSVTYKGKAVHSSVATKLLDLFEQGHDIKPWARFLERVMENPSYKSRKALYDFLESFMTPITSDGCFLAFKRVRSDYMDIHSGTMDNSPGTTVSMPRSEVDDDSNRTCSAGLHACASPYLQGYATSTNNKTVVVKIDPKNVVAVPTDYSFSKMRVCEYEVLGDATEEDVEVISKSSRYDYLA